MKVENENSLNITTEDIEKVSDSLYAEGGALEEFSDIRGLQCYLDDRGSSEVFESIYGRKPYGKLDRTWCGFETAWNHLKGKK